MTSIFLPIQETAVVRVDGIEWTMGTLHFAWPAHASHPRALILHKTMVELNKDIIMFGEGMNRDQIF